MVNGARKDDNGKSPVFQGFINYFPRAIEAVANVSGFGATKYAWNGWPNVKDAYNRYSDAQFRHALKVAKGVEYDDESEIEEAAHEAWNAMARLELKLREREL